MSVSATSNFIQAATYPNELPIAIKSLRPVILDFVNFTDPRFVSFYFSRNCQDPQFIQAAIKIAQVVYETPRRPLEDTYGYSYSLNPEILGFAMKVAGNETVLEIAAARGENALLMAFSDAKEIYYNEINPKEIAAFKKVKSKLPSFVRSKLKDASGNCFKLLEKCPELSNKVGLVFCRNLLHFFNDRNESRFFDLVKRVIKPHGKGIFTVNSSFNFPRKLYEEKPDCTSFFVTQCFFEDYEKPVVNGNFLFYSYKHCESHLIGSPEAAVSFKYGEKQKGGSWVFNQGMLDWVSNDYQQELKNIDPNIPEIKRINEGCIKVVQMPVRAYHPKQLTALFEKQGFEVLHSFAIGDTGHTVSMDEKNEDNINQIGVAVKYRS